MTLIDGTRSPDWRFPSSRSGRTVLHGEWFRPVLVAVARMAGPDPHVSFLSSHAGSMVTSMTGSGASRV